MITIINDETAEVTVRDGQGEKTYALSSAEGFAAVSRAWLRAGWDAKYVYGFSWFGRPIIQLPEDLVRIQEVIYAVKPDVLIETGVAHGGSLVFYASLFKAMGRGRVVGVDIEIRPHNRQAIEAHEFFPLITLIEGSSVDEKIVDRVRSEIKPGDTVMVLLDSNHTFDHVRAELELYAPMVSAGSYIVATDGIMEQVAGAPRTKPDWTSNNPRQAALDFARAHSEFVLEEPTWPFNEGSAKERVTYWPDAFLKRIR
jgi:cephalosporin hydroxylase